MNLIKYHKRQKIVSIGSNFNSKQAKIFVNHENSGESNKTKSEKLEESNFSKILMDRYLNLPDFVFRMDNPRRLTVRELILLNVSSKYIEEARQMIFNPLTLSFFPNLE